MTFLRQEWWVQNFWLCVRHNIQIEIIFRRGRSHVGKTMKKKPFFKEPERERKEKLFLDKIWSKSCRYEHSRNYFWQTVLELWVLSLFFKLSPFTFLKFRFYSISLPGFLASPVRSCAHGWAFRERLEENVTPVSITRTYFLSNLIYIFTSLLPCKAHLPSLNSSYSESYFFFADHYFLRRKM